MIPLQYAHSFYYRLSNAYLVVLVAWCPINLLFLVSKSRNRLRIGRRILIFSVDEKVQGDVFPRTGTPLLELELSSVLRDVSRGESAVDPCTTGLNWRVCLTFWTPYDGNRVNS